MDKIINYGMKQFLEKTRSKETLLSDNDVFNIYFSILHDVAFYLAKLTDTMSSASEVLITIASELNFLLDLLFNDFSLGLPGTKGLIKSSST